MEKDNQVASGRGSKQKRRRRKRSRKRDRQEMKIKQEKKSKREKRKSSRKSIQERQTRGEEHNQERKASAFFGWCTFAEALMQSQGEETRRPATATGGGGAIRLREDYVAFGVFLQLLIVLYF